MNSSKWKDLKKYWYKIHRMTSFSSANESIIKLTDGVPLEGFIDTTANVKDVGVCNTGILRIIKYWTESCPTCQELFPGWTIAEDGSIVPDKNFRDPKRFYGSHFDHKVVFDEKANKMIAKVPEGDRYIRPVRLNHIKDIERVEKHLRCTDTSCSG